MSLGTGLKSLRPHSISSLNILSQFKMGALSFLFLPCFVPALMDTNTLENVSQNKLLGHGILLLQEKSNQYTSSVALQKLLHYSEPQHFHL